MIQRRIGLDAGRQQFIDQPIVEIEAHRIWRAGAIRKDARPGNGKSIGLRAHLLHHRNVLPVTPVVIVGDIAGVAILYLAGNVRKGVPDRLALAVRIRRTFDLVSRRRNAPHKAIRKLRRRRAMRGHAQRHVATTAGIEAFIVASAAAPAAAKSRLVMRALIPDAPACR